MASPGVVLLDGEVVGLWRVKARGERSAFAVEELARVPRRRLEEEATRIAGLRGSQDLEVTWS